MGKAQVSVGDDTPTDEPENGRAGPYITDKDDGAREPKRKGRRQRRRTREDLPTRTETEITKKSESGSDG